jgi:hypothetical protein
MVEVAKRADKGEYRMEVRQVGERANYGLEHRSVIAALAAAGIAGPVIFAVPSSCRA